MYGLIESTFGVSDGLARGLAFAISLAVVLALFALFVLIIKRLTGIQSPTSRSRQPRLAVMDAANIDTRRKLILVRRDNVEHLILIGGTSDLVVEQGIVKGTPVSATHSRQQHVIQPVALDTPTSESENIKAALGAKVPAPEGLEARDGPSAYPKVRRDPDNKESTLGAAVARPATALASRLSRRSSASAPAAHDAIKSRAAVAERSGRDPVLPRERIAGTPTTGTPGVDPGRGPVQSAREAVVHRARATGVSPVPTPAARPTKGEGAHSASVQNNRDPAADLANTLSRSLRAPSGTAGQPAAKRYVTPPSSGPAAQAHTAYPQRSAPPRQEPVVAAAEHNAETVTGTMAIDVGATRPDRAFEPTPAPATFSPDNGASASEASENEPTDIIDDTPAVSNVQSINVAKQKQKQVTLSAPRVDDPVVLGGSITLEKPLMTGAVLANGDATPPEESNTAPSGDATAEARPDTDDPIEDEMASLLDEINGPAKK